ncbi:MAG: hypothetical protein DGJ47_000579 [Rickettsiaceae bacterium]
MKHKLEEYFRKLKINHITANSKEIESNSAFFAIKGLVHDGNEYINEAISSGAKLIFTTQKDLANDHNIIYLENTREAIALAAEIIYPNTPPKIVAVTGTNGKSSVVSYVHQILSLLGKRSASIGTLGVECNVVFEQVSTDGLTTYDPVIFRKLLHNLYAAGVEYVALEASSHGLDQNRLGNLKVDCAGFTNLSQDHLEYHKTMDSYLAAKMKLFTTHLKRDSKALIDKEISVFKQVVAQLSSESIECEVIGDDIEIIEVLGSIREQRVKYSIDNKIYEFNTNIIGSFQANNLLMAARMAYHLGINYNQIHDVLPKVEAVCGRLQKIESNTEMNIFIDYAHTPDALEKSLLELKKLCPNKSQLIVLFGCGGDRDPSKRMVMGQVATKIANQVVITDDNPRTENAANIRNQVQKGALEAKIIGNRRLAILETIESLKKGDILLIAGKGHEDYQIIGHKKIHLSDIEIAQEAIEKYECSLEK